MHGGTAKGAQLTTSRAVTGPWLVSARAMKCKAVCALSTQSSRRLQATPSPITTHSITHHNPLHHPSQHTPSPITTHSITHHNPLHHPSQPTPSPITTHSITHHNPLHHPSQPNSQTENAPVDKQEWAASCRRVCAHTHCQHHYNSLG